MISRTASMSHPYTRSATRKSSVRVSTRVSGIVNEEPKILQRICVGKVHIRPRCAHHRPHEVGWQRRAKLHHLTTRGMTEAQPRRMEEMPLPRQRDEPSSSPAAVGVVTHHRMPDGGEMD